LGFLTTDGHEIYTDGFDRIDRLLQEVYLFSPLKNKVENPASRGVEKYKPIEQLSWSREERQTGKLIKIKNFPSDKKVKLFRVTVSTDSSGLYCH
jgi:hypothetical protein